MQLLEAFTKFGKHWHWPATTAEFGGQATQEVPIKMLFAGHWHCPLTTADPKGQVVHCPEIFA